MCNIVVYDLRKGVVGMLTSTAAVSFTAFPQVIYYYVTLVLYILPLSCNLKHPIAI